MSGGAICAPGQDEAALALLCMEHPYIHKIQAANERLLSTVAGLDDVAMAAPSLLPGWDRAMVLAHLANNADAMRRCVEAASQGQVAVMYPGGDDARNADIEAGRGLSAAVLESRLAESSRRLQEAFELAPQRAWEAKAIARMGEVQIGAGLVLGRLREVEVHHVDLNGGYGPADWDYAWVVEEMDRAMLSLPARLPEDTAVVLTATDSDQHWVAGSGDAVEISGPLAQIFAWVTGRATSVGGQEAPCLGPWR
ncbi:MAG TPA: maleylpyruvate isomerase family mycothiol-dependent enzyme [Acidimicrobiales bacterium]|nr:maleylpyruvate isomerase family mycothiol-dependent enzyme [Acidimicrobiales bacterium]